ncbi:membrane protein insertion efficiency factor YidD [Loktanella salsilacus]|uniref:membrane protein insertion efficiency factor YidD n=1 Tax=Loktanella salsilacus TaxID=195913 RepID=UPI0037044865
MITRAALGGIWIYQTYISPRKGFRCAHSVLHNGTGCSGDAKHVIRNQGFFHAIPSIRQRFKECKIAYHTLHSDQSQPDRSDKIKKSDSCSKQMRDGCCDAAIYEGCNCGSSCFGRATVKASKNCDLDCDVCSCG